MKKIMLFFSFACLLFFVFVPNVSAKEENWDKLGESEEIIDFFEDEFDSSLGNINDNIEENINESFEDEVLNENDIVNDSVINEEVLVQETKVLISKVNEKAELIVGAKLQILNEDGSLVQEWVTDGLVFETFLPAGKYILHEVEAPEGYELAEDKLFEVEVIIDQEIIGDADMNKIPCDHGEDNGTPAYYVTIDSISYETYCINQGLTTPDGVSYDGKIVTPDDIRNFTKQETNIDGEGFTISGTRINVNTETISDYDVSDQTLSNQELYDKILDIIYHRNLASKEEKFSSLSEGEIRFITEFALKNYLNARITTYETYRVLNGTTVDHVRYNQDGELWQTGDGTKYIMLYNKFYNREYLYDINSPTGYIISSGNGDSFGNFAKHWYGSHGKTKVPEIYAELFYYLISDENPHDDSMQLYMYSPLVMLSDTPYQNLLGITGFIEDVKTQEQFIEMVNKYSDEQREISVTKTWEEEEQQIVDRPSSVEINLHADGEIIDTVELNEENNWSYVFGELPVYREGVKIIYTISEISVPLYETIIEGNMETGFNIINSHYATGGTVPPKEEDSNSPDFGIRNPETSDNILKNIIMLFIGNSGLLMSLIIFIKNKNI